MLFSSFRGLGDYYRKIELEELENMYLSLSNIEDFKYVFNNTLHINICSLCYI